MAQRTRISTAEFRFQSLSNGMPEDFNNRNGLMKALIRKILLPFSLFYAEDHFCNAGLGTPPPNLCTWGRVSSLFLSFFFFFFWERVSFEKHWDQGLSRTWKWICYWIWGWRKVCRCEQREEPGFTPARASSSGSC